MLPSRSSLSSPRRQQGVINLGGIGVVLILVFVFYCALGKQGEQRYARICSPFSVTANLFTSIAALLYDGSEVPVKEVFDNITYGCKYTVWRLNNEKEWQAYVDEMKRQGKPIPGYHQQEYQPGQQAQGLAPSQARTISATPDQAGTTVGTPTKPAKPAIDVKGAVDKIDVPSLPPFPGMSSSDDAAESEGAVQ